MAALEPPYRSRGEAQVGRMLDRYGIPFFYEHPTLIYDRGRHKIWHPDFLLPEQNGLIVEYAGMMDVADYAAGIRHKREVYRANGMAAMFLYPADLTGPDCQDQVYQKLLESQNAQPWREAKQRSAPRYRW